MKKTFLLLSPLILVACAPTIQIATPDPVKIDVNMRVDVVTRQEGGTPTPADKTKKAETPQEGRRLRMQEVQGLKSDLKIGEGNDGFLHIVAKDMKGDYAAYVDRIVKEENADRDAIFKKQAGLENKPVEVIVKDFAERARQSSFAGEWIQDNEGVWVKR